MTQMKLSMEQKHEHRQQIGGCQGRFFFLFFFFFFYLPKGTGADFGNTDIFIPIESVITFLMWKISNSCWQNL